MAKFVWPEGVTVARQRDVAIIIHIINEHSPIESDSGRATGLLMGHLEAAGLNISAPWLSKTLLDLEVDGMFGHIIDRTMNGKRTFIIEINPKATLPEDPRRRMPAAVRPLAPALAVADDDDDDDEIEPQLFEDPTEPAAELDIVEGITAGALEPVVIGTDLEELPQPSRADRILYIVSMLNEMLTEELTAPQRDFEDQLGQRLTAVNAIIEDNQKLKAENEKLREDKKKLAEALAQSNAMMRDRASGANRNGKHEPVHA